MTPDNSDKTHCKRGHEFTKDNTAFAKNGSRICRKCSVIRATEYRKERAAPRFRVIRVSFDPNRKSESAHLNETLKPFIQAAVEEWYRIYGGKKLKEPPTIE